MKKTMLILAMVISSVSCFAQQYSLSSLKGRWESNEGAGIEVMDSGKIFLLYNGDRKAIVSYDTNFSKTPCWFDFTISDSSEKISMKSIMLFVNEDLVQWQVFEGDRLSNFSADKGNMVYLRRKK